jgi:hypothetical protein
VKEIRQKDMGPSAMPATGGMSDFRRFEKSKGRSSCQNTRTGQKRAKVQQGAFCQCYEFKAVRRHFQHQEHYHREGNEETDQNSLF